MTLYNAKQTPEGTRITKFTDDLEPEHDPKTGKQSLYITSRDACECPAGHRHTCRHRQMLPKFESLNRIGGHWFYDHDNDLWYYFDMGLTLMTEAVYQQRLKNGRRPAWRRM